MQALQRCPHNSSILLQDCRWDTVDNDRVNGCIRNKENAISQEGGLAVLFGNLAEDGCIVKTAGRR